MFSISSISNNLWIPNFVNLADRNSRPSTPDSETSYRDPGRMLGSGVLGCQEALIDNPILKKLGLAVLQVARGLEPRYLQKPLGMI